MILVKSVGFWVAAAFELADELGGEAEVGGDHILGDALDELGEAGGEAEVAFFAGVGEEIEAVLLGGGEGALNDETEIAAVGRAPRQRALPVRRGAGGRRAARCCRGRGRRGRRARSTEYRNARAAANRDFESR